MLLVFSSTLFKKIQIEGIAKALGIKVWVEIV